MAKTTKGSSDFTFPASKLIEVLVHADCQIASSKLDEAVKDARFELLSRTEDSAVFEIRMTAYERGMTGFDKKKTIETSTRVEWNLKAMTSTWTYLNPSQAKVKLSGAGRIEATSAGCRLHSEATAEVNIVLIGGKIEGLIVAGIDKGRARDAELMREWAKKIG